jgi:hypothetical protein
MPFPLPQNPTKAFCTHVILSNSQEQRKRLEMLPVLRMGVQGTLYQDNSNITQKLQQSQYRQISITFPFNTIFSCSEKFWHFMPYSWRGK